MRNKSNIREITIVLLFIIGIVFIFAGIMILNLNYANTAKNIVPLTNVVSEPEKETARVVRIIDGDTIEIENKVKVRYIGINTPEIVDPVKPEECFGRQAAERNTELVSGSTVQMEKDVSEYDKHGRLLRYVYKDGKMVNEILVAEGFARTETVPPDIKYEKLFKADEISARQNSLGLWKECE